MRSSYCVCVYEQCTNTALFKIFFLGLCESYNIWTLSPLAKAYKFSHNLNIDVLTSSTATPVNDFHGERSIFKGTCKSRFHFCAECKIAGSSSASARHQFLQYVLRAIQQFTFDKAFSNGHMPDTFDITANSYNSSAIQVQIDCSTDDLQWWALDHNCHPDRSLIFCVLWRRALVNCPFYLLFLRRYENGNTLAGMAETFCQQMPFATRVVHVLQNAHNL